jgi:hypothetical protein
MEMKMGGLREEEKNQVRCYEQKGQTRYMPHTKKKRTMQWEK